MEIQCAKLQLPVVTSGCKLAHQEDGENIFPMSVIKTGALIYILLQVSSGMAMGIPQR